jgi:anti-sigma-K factor RskA
MSLTGPPIRPEDGDDFPDLTAGEYVLGVLDAAESAIVRRRIATETAFAAEVARWENQLIPLIEDVAPVQPPASLWEAIAPRLTPVRKTAKRALPGFWDSLAFWRGLTMATGALAAASLAVVVLGRGSAPAPPPAPATGPGAPLPLAVALLTAPKGGAVLYTVTFDEGRRQLIVTPTGGPRPQNRSPEMWLMPDGQAPISMGVLPNGSRIVPAPAGLSGRSTLGVSLEPLGGSPSGAPTGPVIAVGKLTAI